MGVKCSGPASSPGLHYVQCMRPGMCALKHGCGRLHCACPRRSVVSDCGVRYYVQHCGSRHTLVWPRHCCHDNLAGSSGRGHSPPLITICLIPYSSNCCRAQSMATTGREPTHTSVAPLCACTLILQHDTTIDLPRLATVQPLHCISVPSMGSTLLNIYACM